MKRIFGLFLVLMAFLLSYYFYNQKLQPLSVIFPKREVIGFLPYWLLDRASEDYSQYITNLTYFSLGLNEDATVQKYTSPGESEPGHYALTSGKANKFLQMAKEKELTLSLAVFSSDDEIIAEIIKYPEQNARNMLKSLKPIMQKYGFTELNLDIEQVSEASPEARLKFTRFVKAVKNNLNPEVIKSLSIDITGSSLIKKTNLVDPAKIEPYVDKIIIMAYDYHYGGSYVTGAVAPGTGAGIISEFDTVSAIEKALVKLPAKKIILGIPNYGYEWETLSRLPRSATIPGTSLVISNQRAEKLLADNPDFQPKFDETDKEIYLIYPDKKTGTYHQAYFPDKRATQYKVDLAKQYDLAGLAVWALGYEGDTILNPLAGYRN